MTSLRWRDPEADAAPQRRSFRPVDTIRLHANEQPWPPPAPVLAAISSWAGLAHRYPFGYEGSLLEALTNRLQLPTGQVLLGAGSNELLCKAIMALGGTHTETIYPDPSYPTFAAAPAMTSSRGVPVPLLPDGSCDTKAMLAAVTRHTTCVIVSNPNNPTGGAVGQEALTELASDLSDEILLIVDEAYFEYTDEFAEGGRGALKLFELGRPLIVTRTFSKFFGLAGVRLGYAVTSDAELCRELRGHVGPLSVSGLALAAGQAALFAEDEYLERLIKQKEQRSRLWSALDEMGLCPLPTQTNFVYCGEPHPSVADWLAERHLSIRAGSTIGSPGHMRITVGRPEDNELVVSLLRQWLADFGRNWIR